MNEDQAAAALKSLAKGSGQLEGLCGWLNQQEGVAGRYLMEDLARAAYEFVPANRPDNRAQLDGLLASLRDRAPSLLVAFFATDSLDEIYELTGAALGPASGLAERYAGTFPEHLWAGKGKRLAIVVDHPAQYRLGAVRSAAWLQTVLGAIGLAAYARSETLMPLAACPAIESAVFVEGPGGAGVALDAAAGFADAVPIGDVAQVFDDEEAHQLIADATARAPEDLVQTRLTLAARWLQIASSAVNTPDALVALGVALETLAGDDSKGAVVERITKRAAVFLASTVDASEREDVYQEQLRRGKRLYDWRSRAAHGQYDEWNEDQSDGDAARIEFHGFVLDVCLGFRKHARDRGMGDVGDLKRWWGRVEIEGVFA